MARTDEDVSWLSIFLSDIPHTVYQVGSGLPVSVILGLKCSRTVAGYDASQVLSSRPGPRT